MIGFSRAFIFSLENKMVGGANSSDLELSVCCGYLASSAVRDITSLP